jgi:hypothetical protein
MSSNLVGKIEEYILEKHGEDHPNVTIYIPVDKFQYYLPKVWWKIFIPTVIAGISIMMLTPYFPGIYLMIPVLFLGVLEIFCGWLYLMNDGGAKVEIEKAKFTRGSWVIKSYAEAGLPMNEALGWIDSKIEKQERARKIAEDNIQKAMDSVDSARPKMLVEKLQAMEADISKVQEELESLGVKDLS